MATSLSIPVLPSNNALDALSANPTAATKAAAKIVAGGTKAKAWKASQDFEQVFLNNMFKHMFTSTEGEGPLGGQGASGVWRSFLVDKYAENFTKAGGIGIAKQVYSSLLAQQEIAR
jgi:Rod binding domain-containing protein